jgi:phosphomannomutase
MIEKVSEDILSVKDKLFKSTAYDIRAYVGEPGAFFSGKAVLTPSRMRVAGVLLASMEFKNNDGEILRLKPGNKVVVGYDNGPTSKALADAFSAGLTEQGIDVYDVGIASSGQVYHNQEQFKADGYVQITRSHVEVTSNGAKFGIFNQGIHTYLLGQMNAALGKGGIGRDAPAGSVIDKAEAGYKIYAEKIRSRYSDFFKKNKPSKPIAVNLFGGTGLNYEKLFREVLGEDIIILGDTINVNDGSLLADPTRREMLERVPKLNEVLSAGARVHSFDLDADRGSLTEGEGALSLSKTGHYLGDDLSFILAEYKLKIALPALAASLEKLALPKDKIDEILKTASIIYVDPRYTSAVKAFVEERGGTTIYHRKGHSLWKETMGENMRKMAAAAGFKSAAEFVKAADYRDIQVEASLHMFATDPEDAIARDDAIENVFLLETIISALNIIDLADFFKKIPRRFATKEIRTNSISVEAKEAITYDALAIIRETFGKTCSIVEFDGQIRADFPRGFLMYGMSNTSAKLTFMAEGDSVDLRNNALAYIMALHNSLKAKHGDDLLMDLSENPFFIKDKSYDMAQPDAITFEDARVKAFLKGFAH